MRIPKVQYWLPSEFTTPNSCPKNLYISFEAIPYEEGEGLRVVVNGKKFIQMYDDGSANWYDAHGQVHIFESKGGDRNILEDF